MQNSSQIAADTSVFINPDAFALFGETPTQAFCTFVERSKSKNIKVYMPPSVLNETLYFLDNKAISPDITSYIIKKPPKKYEIFIPSLFLYEIIEEIRIRINKGLRIGEKYTRYGISGKKPEKELIKSIREEYRVALREGIVDSKQDIDLLILAKEIDSSLLTADQGLIKWAQKLGIVCLDLKEVQQTLFNP